MSILNGIASYSLQIFTNSLHSEENKPIKSVDRRETVYVNNAAGIDSNKVRTISRDTIPTNGFITGIKVCQYDGNEINIICRIMQLK